MSFRYYFVYHEEYFLMNKTLYKLFFTVFQRCSLNNVLKQTTQFYRKTPMYESFGFKSDSSRRSCLQVIFKVAVLKNLAKVIGKHLWWSSLSVKFWDSNFTIKGLHQTFVLANFYKFFIFFIKYYKRMVLLLLSFYEILPVFWQQYSYTSIVALPKQ